MATLISCNNISKKYDKNFYALKDVTLTFDKGIIYGLIGRNGAGKTTLLKTLTNQLFPSTGEVTLASGVNVCLSRDYQHFFLKQKCSNLFLLAREQYPNWNTKLEKELIGQLQFPYKKVYEKVSRGNQNLLNIIIALCSNADVILLDEPYTGLDPVNRKIIYQHILRLNEERNMTFVISSHLITELENMLQHVIMIDSGNIVINDALDTIKSKAYRFIGTESLLNEHLNGANIISKEKLGNQLTVDVYDTLNQELINRLQVEGISISSLDLQDLMVGLSSKGGRSA